MKSQVLTKLLKAAPLELRLKTIIETHFISDGGGYLIQPLTEMGDVYPEVEALSPKRLPTP